MLRTLLVVTRDLRVAFPPELFPTEERAESEVRRWLWHLHAPKAIGKNLVAGSTRIGRSSAVHLAAMEMPLSWSADPMWVTVRWSESSYPKLRIIRFGPDEDDQRQWVASRIWDDLIARDITEWHAWFEFLSHGRRQFAGTFRIKRLVG